MKLIRLLPTLTTLLLPLMIANLASGLTIINNSGLTGSISLRNPDNDEPIGIVSLKPDQTRSITLGKTYNALKIVLKWVEEYESNGIIKERIKHFTTIIRTASYEPETLVDDECAIIIDKPTSDDPIHIKLIGKKLKAALKKSGLEQFRKIVSSVGRILPKTTTCSKRR